MATDLGWWTISGEAFLAALQRVADGDHPMAVYAEMYANSEREDYREAAGDGDS